MRLRLNQLSCNPDLQIREQVFDFGVVEDYAESMKAGATFPPITVFFDGATYWLADGFHRYAAAQQAKIEDIEADVREGSKRDAILYAVGANSDNGLRRTNADKRNAVMKLLNDKEWARWPQTDIAKACRVAQSFVSKLVNEHPELSYHRDKIKEVVRSNGTTYTMNTANIGHRETIKPIVKEQTRIGNTVYHPTSTETSPLPTWALPEESEPATEEQFTDDCGSCRFYKPDSGTDQFYCLSLERIYDFRGYMPCNGKQYEKFELGFCECCGQKLP